MFEGIDFKGGKVVHDDFKINCKQPLNEQLDSLKEDLFQVRYSNKTVFTIDIGWYPEMDPTGSFITYIIKNFDWENPLFRKKSKSIDRLNKHLKEAITLVNNIKCPCQNDSNIF